MKNETNSYTSDVTVVGGAGRDGIGLVLALADKGLTINVNDLDNKALEQLKMGQMPYVEAGAARLLKNALDNKRLVFSNSPNRISPQGPVIIVIGTSVDEFSNPSRKSLQDCIDGLLPHMGAPRLIVLRASVFPGTTDWLDGYVKGHGYNHRIAFCPERAVQGVAIEGMTSVPQIVGSTNLEAENEAIALFQPIIHEFVALSPKEAEFARLFNNAYKYIDLAITNEFYLITKSAGLDYQRVLQGMKHENPGARSILSPGFVGGANLRTDTLQLAATSRNNFGLLTNTALFVNEGLVLQVVDHLQHNFDLSQKTVGLLGMAFKPQSDDIRASLSYKFKKLLRLYAREVLTTDPLVKVDNDLLTLNEVVTRSDILILCTRHEIYKTADLQGKPVFDIWGFLEHGNMIK